MVTLHVYEIDVYKQSEMWVLCREVKEGTSQTLYPMDPERELDNLRRNWATFKRDFKVTCVYKWVSALGSTLWEVSPRLCPLLVRLLFSSKSAREVSF